MLGEKALNQGPTQDWEFDLINHQMAGNLDKPAYKNLTPEMVQLAAEKGAPAQGEDTERSHVQRRREQREGVTGGKPSLGSTPTPIDPNQREKSRHGTRTPKTGRIQVPPRFQQLVQDLGVDVEANYKEAGRMVSRLNVPEFVKAVTDAKRWDYKKHKEVQQGGKFHGKYSTKLLDDFGNWHFGVVAHGFGWNMETSLMGAGGNQVINQGGGDPAGFKDGLTNWLGTAGGLLQYDRTTERETYGGKSWGDNPGDAINIMEGWKDANKAH